KLQALAPEALETSDSPDGRDRPCSAGLGSMTVTPTGNAKPCVTMRANRLSAGNVRDASLERLWNGPELPLFRERAVEGAKGLSDPLEARKCVVCPVRWWNRYEAEGRR